MMSRSCSSCMSAKVVECTTEFVKPCSSLDTETVCPSSGPCSSDSEEDPYEGSGAPLLGHRRLQHLLLREGLVEAELVPGPSGHRGDFEVCAMPPCEIEIQLPWTYLPGQGVAV